MESKVLLRSSPAREVVLKLKRHGQMSIKELVAALGVTRTAVRQQLAALEETGLVGRASERRGVGRPAGVYFLTDEGHRLFGREYEPLLRLLLEELASSEDPGELRTLLGRVSRKMAARFEPVSKEGTLGERLASLVEQFTSRGHLTEAEVMPEGFTLQMYNCPYRELVADYPAICEMEQSMLRRLLGPKVKRHKCILDERHTHCSYSVTGSGAKTAAAR